MGPFHRDRQIERVKDDAFAPWYLLWPQRVLGSVGLVVFLPGLLRIVWPSSSILNILVGGGFFLILSACAYEFMAEPWLLGWTGPKRWPKRFPRRELRGMIRAVWVPPLAVVFITLTAAAKMAIRHRQGRPIAWDNPVFESMVSLAVFVPLALWAGFVSWRLPRRFRAATLRRGICFDCGYNLRGNPDAATCPECGADTPEWVGDKPNVAI